MEKQKKICFVIMGFGKKTDPDLGKTYDLDKTYKNIIKPAVTDVGYECVRADEILDSGIIDKSMYALLMQADLVIADITTFNPNAIYELGIRHGVRPYSTIILKEKSGKIPFDLDHSRIFQYTHLGDDIGVDEADRCRSHLIKLIENIDKQQGVDSPLYEYIENITPPILPKEEYIKLIDELSEKETLIFALVEKAKMNMSANDFEQAAIIWQKLSDQVPTEPYFTQQYALSTYKKNPKDITTLAEALTIISKIEGKNTNDPETLGITGAIYKNLWWTSNEISSLDKAIEFYGKCYKITNDYYNGENYAFCLDEKKQKISDQDEKIYCKIEAKKVRENIINDLTSLISIENIKIRNDAKWIYATLSNCHLSNNNITKAEEFKKLFFSENPESWEKSTFENTKRKIIGEKNGKA